MTQYCIDTSTWIHLAENYAIGKGVMRALWETLDRLATARLIMSPDEVWIELAEDDDAIKAWVKDRKRFLIRPHDHNVQRHFREVRNTYPLLTSKGKPQAKHEGDAWVIALAKQAGAIVVSEETDELKKQEQKLPGVCRLMGIRHITTAEFIDKAME